MTTPINFTIFDGKIEIMYRSDMNCKGCWGRCLCTYQINGMNSKNYNVVHKTFRDWHDNDTWRLGVDLKTYMENMLDPRDFTPPESAMVQYEVTASSMWLVIPDA